MSSVPQSGLPQQGPRRHLIDALRGQLDRWGKAAGGEDAPVFSCGTAAIDRLLPGGGLRHGMLVEWVDVGAGGSPARRGATGEPPVATLALLSAREACREGGTLVVIDRQQTFYPPAAAAWGIDLERLIVVRPLNVRDELWAAVESLRSPAVAAMWAALDRLDSRAFRRLQLAAEAGRTLGLLLRPARARAQPSWADVRLEVEGKLQNENWRSSAIENLQFRAPPEGWSCNLQSSVSPFATRSVQVQVLHCHGGRPDGLAMLEIDDVAHTVQQSLTHDAHPLPVAAQLADPAAHSRSARA